MSGLDNYSAAPAAPEKKNWFKLGATGFMILIVEALFAMVASNTVKWLFVSTH